MIFDDMDDIIPHGISGFQNFSNVVNLLPPLLCCDLFKALSFMRLFSDKGGSSSIFPSAAKGNVST